MWQDTCHLQVPGLAKDSTCPLRSMAGTSPVQSVALPSNNSQDPVSLSSSSTALQADARTGLIPIAPNGETLGEDEPSKPKQTKSRDGIYPNHEVMIICQC